MMPPVQFGSTIRIVSEPAFYDRFNENDLTSQDMYAGVGNNFDYRHRVRMKPAGITSGAFDCNAGGFQNGEKVTLFHLKADEYTTSESELNETMDILESDIRQLKTENPTMRAFLSGGWDRDEDSLVLKEALQLLFSKWRIPTSILWGADGIHVHYDTETDTWTLASKKMEEITTDELRRHFSHIRIAPGDELIIETDDGDQKIDPEDANINKLDD